MINDWANDNVGSVELSGNLAAVGQRHRAIEKQIQQIAALKELAEAQRRQQLERELLEQRQNILYDISATLEDIKGAFKHDPVGAYYNFLVLEEYAFSLGLNHRMFSSLDWKNHCDTTLARIGELRSWCSKSLDQRHIQEAENVLAKQKLARKHEVEERTRIAREARIERFTKRAKRESIKFRFALGLGLFSLGLWIFFISDDNESGLISGGLFVVSIVFLTVTVSSWEKVQIERNRLANLGRR